MALSSPLNKNNTRLVCEPAGGVGEWLLSEGAKELSSWGRKAGLQVGPPDEVLQVGPSGPVLQVGQGKVCSQASRGEWLDGIRKREKAWGGGGV